MEAHSLQVIKTPVADDIRQLIISPNGNYLAILTTHTVHVAILPAASHLTAADKGPIRIKTFQLGPTTHVTTQSGIASALWHPLGVHGTCLVTVTEDAVVRVWELSPSDRRSFDKATLSIDLKKLADGVSADQDFGATVSGINTGFSPDSFDMEVASACFPAKESGGWSPMTLWIAMKEGDVYALCPLLPSKWSPPPTLIPSLSVSIVAKNAAIEDDIGVSAAAKRLAQQQLDWMAEIDNQEPLQLDSALGGPPAEVYYRPRQPGHVPKLQGPFELDLTPDIPDGQEDELDTLLTDIYAIGAKMDSEELMLGEEDDLETEDGGDGLSVGVVCLLSRSGQVSVLLDLDGVQAQWLPKSKSKISRFSQEVEPPSLLTFEVLETSNKGENSEDSWPMFSRDFQSDYTFYVTDASKITYISLDWVSRLEPELNGGQQGSDFRIDLLVKGNKSTRERLMSDKLTDKSSILAALIVIMDPDLGYFLLSSNSSGPVALTLETPEDNFDRMGRSRSLSFDSEPDKPLVLCEPRPVYQPASIFNESSALPRFLEKIRHEKYKRLLKEEVRLSPATLTIMTEAHTILSEETHRLGSAAAELFRRCERLQIELKSQISKANEVSKRVEAITGADFDPEPEGAEQVQGTNEIIEARLGLAMDKQAQITKRIDNMRKRIARERTRELSEKEKAWMDEIATLESKLEPSKGNTVSAASTVKEPWQRYEEIEALKNELIDQANGLVEETDQGTANVRVPSEIRKAKVAQITAMLDRETALVEGAKSRLERLTLA